MDGNQSSDNQPELPPVQPGQTFSPGGASGAPSPSAVAAPTPAAPVAEQTTPLANTSVEQPAASNVDTTPAPYASVSEPMNDFSTAADEPMGMEELGNRPVSWTASEFIAHEKSNNWYVLLVGGAIVAAVIVWLITKDLVSSIVIILAVGVLAAYARRSPRELQYTLDGSGITIGEKHYPYANFRSFSIIEEGAFSSIELLPLKRFSPPISVYYDPANEEAIAAALTPHLPFQPREQDPIDKLMRRIRF